jgi:hypothetical protein
VSRLTVYTSLPPHLVRRIGDSDYDRYQDAVLGSWEAAGFRIVSVNSEDEIESFKGKWPLVEFASTGKRNGRPQFASLLDRIRQSKEPKAGIINADCLFFNYSTFAERILAALPDSIVIFERLNIDSETVRPTGRTRFGIDGFFFDTKFLATVAPVAPAEYELGEPAWDYWFPLAMCFAGAVLKAPEAPVLLHIDHDPKWSMEKEFANGHKLLAFLRSQKNDPIAIPGFIAAVNSIKAKPGDSHIYDLGMLCFHSLRESAKKITLGSPGTHEELTARMVSGLYRSNEFHFKEMIERAKLRNRVYASIANARQVSYKIVRRVKKGFPIFTKS